MDSESPNCLSTLTEDERNTFLKVFNTLLGAELNSKTSVPTGADYKVFVTKTWYIFL